MILDFVSPQTIFIPADFTCYSNVRLTEIASNVEFSVIQFIRLTAKYENRTANSQC